MEATKNSAEPVAETADVAATTEGDAATTDIADKETNAATPSNGEEAKDDAAETSQPANDEKDEAEKKDGGEGKKPEEGEPAPEQPPDWKDRYARAMADFDNFRKRTARDREDLVKFAAADVIKAILPTVDNLALALDKAKDKADDPFVAGVKLVYDGLMKALSDQGATPLDSVGEPFDANFHDALAQLPSAEVEEGVVMNEVKRGWLLHGKLLRAAQVVVSAGKSK